MKTITPTTKITPAVRHFISQKERLDDRKRFFRTAFTNVYRIAFKQRERNYRRLYSINDIREFVMQGQPDSDNNRWRKREIVIRRQVGMTVAHIFFASLSESGKLFNKNHATVLHSIEAINNAIETNDRSVIPLLVKVFGIFYKQHLFDLENYGKLTFNQQKNVEDVKFKLKKYRFCKLLIEGRVK